jgi:hypothetical protein
MNKRKIYALIPIILFLLITISPMLMGQPPLPGGHGYNGNQGTGGAAPVDGGGLLLLAGGLGYGVIKYIRNRVKDNNKLNN